MSNPMIKSRVSPTRPAGGPRSTWRTALEAGAALVQDMTPLWSFNRDGEADESLNRDFAQALGVDEGERREKRAGLAPRAHPQHGVDAMAADFEGTTPLPGVVEARGRAAPGSRPRAAASEIGRRASRS
jgi:hypothetical protein